MSKKTGLDDYLKDHTVEDLQDLVCFPDSRPRLHGGTARLDQLVDDAWDELLGGGGTLYRQGSRVVEIETSPSELPQTWPLDENSLRYVLAGGIDFFARKQVPLPNGGQQIVEYDVQAPLALAKTMLSMARRVPVLLRVSPVPYFGANGRLIQTPGYDERSMIFYAPIIDVKPIPTRPTARDIAAAVSIVDTTLQDFPFASQADKAHAIALGIEPFARAMIDGPMPIHLFESPTPGTGKGLLADVMLRASLGGYPRRQPAPDSDAEYRKVITAAVEEGAAVVVFDNLKDVLDSGSLAAAVTTTIWADRKLGTNQTINGQINWSWVVTANNPVLGDDFTRRCVRTRIMADVEKPSERDFAIDNLKDWVAQHEGDLAWAFLTLIQAWVSAGMRPWTGQTFGSFEKWSRVIGGVLETAGIGGFLKNTDELYDSASTEAGAWRAFTEAWWEKHEDKGVTAAQLFPLVRAYNIDLALEGKDDQGQMRSLGTRIGRQRDRIYGDLTITRNDRTRKWSLRNRNLAPSAPSAPSHNGMCKEDKVLEPVLEDALGALGASPDSTFQNNDPIAFRRILGEPS